MFPCSVQRPLGVAKGAVADARRPVAGATFPLAVAAAAVAVPLARAAQEVQHATQVRCCSGQHTAAAPRSHSLSAAHNLISLRTTTLPTHALCKKRGCR